jgi:FAD-dependent urate hydroxylase
MTMTRALIIGGGIAGPVAAMALQRAGIDAVIYEDRPADADNTGVFLGFASNGIDALRALDADAGVLATGFPTPVIGLRSGTGRRLGAVTISTTRPGKAPTRTLRRADLYRVLHEEAGRRGIRTEHGKRMVRAEESGEQVRAEFADGTHVTGDLLIGCDGVHSAVRGIIDPAAPAPTYAGMISLGGYVRGAEVDAAPGTYTMIWGRRAFFGYAVAHDGEVWWFANVPRRGEPARGEVQAIGGAEWQQRLTRLYAGDAGPAARLVQATPPQVIAGATPVHMLPHLPTWYRGRMVVIGDAAHAPSPSSGQGASLAVEDAVMLARCLRDLPGHTQAYARFEALRRPRVERIIKAAARTNQSKTPGPVARILRDLLLPVVLKPAARSKRATRQFDYVIDWNEKVREAA